MVRALEDRDVLVQGESRFVEALENLGVLFLLFPKLVVRALGKWDFVVWSEQSKGLGKPGIFISSCFLILW